MLQKLVIQKIIDIVIKKIFKKFDLNRIKKYVEEPNELDVLMGKLNKEVRSLKESSHPPMFTKREHENILKRLKNLEKEKTKC